MVVIVIVMVIVTVIGVVKVTGKCMYNTDTELM